MVSHQHVHECTRNCSVMRQLLNFVLLASCFLWGSWHWGCLYHWLLPALVILFLLMYYLVQPPYEGLLPCLTVSVFVLFAFHLLKAYSFLVKTRKGTGSGGIEGVMELGGVDGGEPVLGWIVWEKNPAGEIEKLNTFQPDVWSLKDTWHWEILGEN